MDASQRTGFIAGVGASAGGLESLEQFFRAMPSDTGLAFVVVQHLSPDHKSLMEELFTRFTSIPVREAKHHEPVLANHIYLLPPGKELEICDGRLEVTDRQQDRYLSFPIDRFLTSLAADCGPRAVAVILSGSGSDGSRGARRVQAQGGLVLVEDPETASFDGMPRAAIETGVVDAVMSAQGLAQALVEHVTSGELPHGEAARVVEDVIALLRSRKRIDFDDYKRSTVYRRMLRRARLAAQDLADYLRLLEQDPAELSALHYDLLIGVTNFFRDEAGFNVLARQIDEMVQSPVEPERELRAWVAGCASGEEAFSVAIMLDDAIRKAGARRGFKVFATDIHDGALETAGAGIFPHDRLKGINDERLAAHFARRPDGRWQVNPEIRHRIVFAKHNLLTDTPFTNLDLVTCRNLLIYLRPQAQRRALASLSYGLRIGGLLFLGSSESPGELQPCFDAVSEQAKVYRKRVHSRSMRRPEVPTRVAMRTLREGPRARDSHLLATYDALLERFMPPGFLVSEQRALLESFNGAEGLLRVPSRRLTTDFLELVPDEVRLPLTGALARASRESGPVRYAPIEWPTPGGARHFELTVERLSTKSAESQLLVCLAEREAPVREPAVVAEIPVGSERVLSLEDELTRTRESLQATVEELEASNEELQATNEEMVASNEELQSVNEELHSVNEELHTVNAEHQRKIAELSEVNRDTSHLLESIDVATLYLDGELRIRKYTPLAASIFSLVEHDTGRLLESFNHPLVYPEFMADVRRVRDGHGRIEHEVQSRGGKWYLVRLLPYRVASDAIDGVVVTLTDATALAAAKVRARQLSSIVDSSADAIVGLDLDGAIRSWNAGAERLYGYTTAEALGCPASMLVPPEERPAFEAILAGVARGGDAINVDARRRSKAGEVLEIATTVFSVRDAAGAVTGIASIDRDVRAQKELERRLRESEGKYLDLYDNAPDMYLSIDARSGRIVEHNATFRRIAGYEGAEIAAMHVLDLFEADCQDAVRQLLANMRAGTAANDVALRMRRSDASALEVTLSSTVVLDAEGAPVRSHAIMRDVTERRLAEQKVVEAATMREQFLAMVSHELRSPLHAVNAALQIIDSPNASDVQRTRSEGVVRRQVKQMVRLVDDLLDVSRITHGKLVLERAAIDLVDVARTALEAAAAAFSEKGVVLLTEGLEQRMPAFGDAGRLAQVFGNLLQNAIRFTPEGRQVLLRATRDGDLARFEVIDQGRGIEAADLQAIFQMFVQSRQGLARSEGGLGLGLTIAERIVTAHGGRIVAASAGPGRGATFTVTLALDERAAVREEGGEPESRPLRIVVVEDQADAREALGMILAQRPDVALLDVGLPGMNGYEIATSARESLGNGVTLIAMSGYGQPEDVRRAEAAGFDRHLTKPVDPRRLSAALRDLRWRESFAKAPHQRMPDSDGRIAL